MTEENKVESSGDPSGKPEERGEDTVGLSSLPSRSVEVFTDEMDVPIASAEGGSTATVNHSGGDRLGRYELVRILGQGAFAEVWLAMEDGEHGFRKRVALKILKRDVTDDETYEALLHEARVCGHLHHGNIVDAMEWVRREGPPSSRWSSSMASRWTSSSSEPGSRSCVYRSA